MSYTLHKCSMPGWEKSFDDIDAAREELLRHICDACLAGGEWSGFDERGVTTGIINCENPPDKNNISDLLSTACGCEYELEENSREISSSHSPNVKNTPA